MVNLVRQDDILRLIDWYQTEYCEAETYFEVFRRDIESWTSVDAVPVIRCADCVHCQYDAIYGDRWCDGRKVWRDHFCSSGKRKESDNDV